MQNNWTLDTAPGCALSEKLPEVLGISCGPFDYIWAEKAHVAFSSELVHVLHGWINIEMPDRTVNCLEGDTVYIPKGMMHRDIMPLEESHEIYQVQFAWDGEDAACDLISGSHLAGFSQAYKHLIRTEFSTMYQWFIGNQPYHAEVTRLHLLQTIYKLCSISSLVNFSDQAPSEDLMKSRRLQIMMYAREYIKENFQTNITLEKIASELNISTYYLSRIFSSENSFTLSSYLTSVRMENAAKLLVNPGLNISDVSQKVGFNDPHYFSKIFKIHYRISPKTFRSNMLKTTQI